MKYTAVIGLFVITMVKGFAQDSIRVEHEAGDTIKEATFNQGNVHDIYSLIDGLSTGLLVTKQDANPNQLPEVLVRGVQTLSNRKSPLIVVDGFVGLSEEGIDLNDIASIRLLKGFETAKYGVLGASGVLLIETKKAEKNGLNISANLQGGVQNKIINDPYMSTQAYINAGGVDYGEDTDWIGLVTQRGSFFNGNVAVRGKTDAFTYGVSGNFRSVDGVQKQTGFERANFLGNLTWRPIDRLSVAFRTSFTKEEAGMGFGEMFLHAKQRSPTVPVYHENGDLYKWISFEYEHPLDYLLNASHTRNIQSLFFSGNLAYDFGFLSTEVFYSQFQRDFSQAKIFTQDFNFNFLRGTGNGTGLVQKGNNAHYGLRMSTKQFGDEDFNWTFNGGYEVLDFSNDNLILTKRDAEEEFTEEQNQDHLKINSLVFGWQGQLRDWLTLGLHFRSDESSNLGEREARKLYPNFSAALGLDDLLNWSRSLVFMLGYGQAGMTLIDDDLNSSNDDFAYNANLGAELSTNIDLGINYQFNESVSLGLNWFRNRVENLHNPIYMADEAAFLTKNKGGLTNSGFEIQLKTDFSIGSFRWQSGLQLSTLKTAWDESPFGDFNENYDLIAGCGCGGNVSPSFLIEKGGAFGTYIGHVFEGLDENGEVLLKDLNGDGVVTPLRDGLEDADVFGQVLPKSWFGWRNELQFKKTTLTLMFDGAFGHSVSNQNNMFFSLLPSTNKNLPATVQDLIVNSNYLPSYASHMVEKGDYFRLQYLSVAQGFTVSNFNIEVYATVNNVFSTSSFSGDTGAPLYQFDEFRNQYISGGFGMRKRSHWMDARSFGLGLRVAF